MKHWLIDWLIKHLSQVSVCAPQKERQPWRTFSTWPAFCRSLTFSPKKAKRSTSPPTVCHSTHQSRNECDSCRAHPSCEKNHERLTVGANTLLAMLVRSVKPFITFIYLSLSLSLSLFIYIYIYTRTHPESRNIVLFKSSKDFRSRVMRLLIGL